MPNPEGARYPRATPRAGRDTGVHFVTSGPTLAAFLRLTVEASRKPLP